MERITSKEEAKMQDSRHLQDVAYNAFQPYVDAAYDLIFLYHEEEILQRVSRFSKQNKKSYSKTHN